ncbi:stealth family protein [Desulfovibrio litoralis]|uniref:Stealth protein CR1, conserved region 1 n=1 Tax=Desulfovibrio litoralis DSM 11393 TaxID=1121455 RepID=A0A1M7S199_9BACT|nr:stealth family protein [Desulfovibrio litoralis]SHN52180.1 Stealth protein CR1, conserved region 1 [Desulfovibrio litoralis DSM 11393]
MKYLYLPKFFRNFLIRYNALFSCCAACYEILSPNKKRICSSLDVEFSNKKQNLPALDSQNVIKTYLLRYLSSLFINKIPELKACVSCPYRLPNLTERIEQYKTANFPVDLVYTWVDGEDSAHIALRNQYLREHAEKKGEMHEDGVGKAHFRNNDELKYSLRSVEAFLPWVRNIFIVTAGQKPKWLHEKHPKIKIVDHKDFIPEQYLPTFSCRPIEAFLHRIPDLSEHYIYLNDDFFFARPCLKEEFFTASGKPYLFLDWRNSRLDGYFSAKTPHAKSYTNVFNFMSKKGLDIAKASGIVTAHVPYPQTKRNAENACDFFQEAIDEYAQDKFRTSRGMAFYPHAIPLLSFLEKTNVPCDVSYFYINTKRIYRKLFYKAILAGGHNENMPPFFCLNDAGVSKTDSWARDMRGFLEAYYPIKSCFEY